MNFISVKADFLELLKETSDLDRHSRWSDVKKKLDSDPRYKAVDSSTRREDWFKDYIRTIEKEADENERKAREKQARVEASMKEREKEVKESLESSLRERDKERDQHKKDEAVQTFKALLVDLVRNVDASWHDNKKLLRKDQRWSDCELLERSEKQKLHEEHIKNLTKKSREMFHRLLTETTDIALTSQWKDVKKLIKEDPRYSKFSSSDRKREREFDDFIQERLIQAKADLRELLKETKLITYKSYSMIDESSGQHLKDIENILENDKRYLVLDSVAEERKKIVLDYIKELDRQGAPPPPTASEPSRRSTK